MILKCVIFDMDGTISDTIPLCLAAFREAVTQFTGRPVSDDEILTTFGPSEEGTIQTLVPEQHEEALEAFLEHYRRLHQEINEPFDGVRELLDSLKSKGVLLALVTGKGKRSLAITMETLGLTGYFVTIETGSPSGPDKANGMRRVLQTLGLKPQECVYVGDSPGDVTASREVDVPVISAAWASSCDPKRLKEMSPDYLCDSVAQLQDTLFQLLERP